MNTIHWPMIWALVIIVLLTLEGIALGTGHPEYTLSYTIAIVRHDPVGRFVFWSVWGFMTAHFGFSPTWLGVAFNWRAIIGIAIGLAIATFETVKIVRAARAKTPTASAAAALLAHQTITLAQTRDTLLKFKVST